MATEEETPREARKCLLQYLCMLLPLAVVGVVTVLSLVVLLLSLRQTTRAMDEASVETMGLALRHVAGNMMQPLLEANRSAAAIADAVRDPASSDDSSPASISQVRPKMFMAFATQPLLAQVSYAGADGHAFAFYRTEERGEARALFTDSQKRWCTQAVDPATGRLVGSAAATDDGVSLPNTTTTTRAALVAGRNAAASPPASSLGEGWARPGARMLFFSAPVGGGGGVVSAAVSVRDVFEAAAAHVGVQNGLDVYYAVGDDKDDDDFASSSSSTASYEPLMLGYQYRTADDTAEDALTFSKLTCAASAIDAAAPPELGQLVSGGPKYNRYRAGCAVLDVSGVQVALRLVLRPPVEGHMLQVLCIPVIVSACALLVVAAVSFAVAARALRRAAAREMALNADLVRQKEALRQAERKSMNKSNAFASASHDIRSALAAIAGLVDMSRPEAQSLPGVVENLDQMGVCTNKLFDILNSILDTSKVESGKMQLEEAEFSMADVVQESMDMANVTGVRRGVEVVWDPCDFSVLRCAAVLGDSKRLKQILDNLLGNALKFTDDGHVVLRGWATRPIARSGGSAPSRFAHPTRRGGGGGGGSLARLFRGAREDPDGQDHVQSDPSLVEFYFEVVDTGIGIPKEKRMSVFENYVQVTNGQGGTGLGLGIVQSFVRLMGGEISIKDKEPGERGTCFAFNVLLKMSEVQEVQQPQDIEEGPSVPSGTPNFIASAFQEASSFKGVHCVLYVHGSETRRILQTWMESIGVKVWLVRQAELIGSTLEKAQSNSMATAAANCGGGGGDRCFSSSKEMVSQLRNSAGPRRASLLGGTPSGILVVIDVSGGGLEEICQEMAKLARIIKHEAPCKVVLLEDIKTPSSDLRRLKEQGCDLVLRKPVHGSRLFTLLMTLRDLQVSDAQAQPSQVGPDIAGSSSQQQGFADAAAAVPCVQLQEAAASTEASEDDKPLAGMQVLLAEDTLVLQTIQRKILNQLGATVTVAEDGAVAVTLLKEALEQANVSEEDILPLPYHVIFMDCQMPNMDGYEATKLIREEEQRYGIHTPIIALTAHNTEEDLQKAIDAGMDLHLTKPILRNKIVEAVRSVFKRAN